jgi:hypothetical protein
MKTAETAMARNAIFACVVPLAWITEWLVMARPLDFDDQGIAQACFRRMSPMFRLYRPGVLFDRYW